MKRLTSQPFVPIIAILLLHAAVLFTSQRHVDGDEGVVGIMTQHIIERGSRPIFFYGQAYGAGASLEAYLATPFIALFGQSSPAFKSVTLFISLLTLIVLYQLLQRFVSQRAALFGLLMLGVATPLVEWRTKLRGGYVALPLLILLTLYCYQRIVSGERRRMLDYFLLGLVAGVGFYNSALSISLLVAVAVASLVQLRRFWRWQTFAAIPGFALGCAPLLYYDLTNDFAHLRYLLRVDSAENSWRDLPYVLRDRLPRFFVGRNVDLYITDIPTSAWIEYLLVATLCLVGIAIIIRSGRRWHLLHTAILFIIIHLYLFTTSGDRDVSPRYLLPLAPAFAVIGAIVLSEMAGWKPIGRTISYSLLSIWLVTGLFTHLRYIHAPTVTDDVLLQNGQIVNVQTAGDLAQRLNHILLENGITHARTSYFLQWRMLYEGAESVIVSSEWYFPTVTRYGEYNARVDSAEKVAIILHEDSLHLQNWLTSAAIVNYQPPITVDAYQLFLPK